MTGEGECNYSLGGIQCAVKDKTYEECDLCIKGRMLDALSCIVDLLDKTEV